MGAEQRNSKKENFSRQSVAVKAMTRSKRITMFGPFRVEGRNASVWRNSIAISLVLLVGVLVILGYNWNRSALPQTGREQGAVDKQNFRVFGYKIVEEYPHDPAAFTQGLLYDGNDTFYESTGLYAESSVRKVDIKTGKVKAGTAKTKTGPVSLWGGFDPLGFKILKRAHLILTSKWANYYWIPCLHQNFVAVLLQLTWLTKKGYIYDKDTLKLVGTFEHPMKDGWGLTSSKDHLVGSDGTANVYFMDPSTFREIRKVVVNDDGHPVPNLNELEYIKGEIWANVFMTGCIARIAPQDGNVTGWILLHGLRNDLVAQGLKLDVLNGIAWDSKRDKLFVTGKLWPKVYEIELVDQTSQYKDLNGVRKLCIRKEVWR